jgi:hypothetical protein
LKAEKIFGAKIAANITMIIFPRIKAIWAHIVNRFRRVATMYSWHKRAVTETESRKYRGEAMSDSDSRFSVKPPWIQYPGNPPYWGGWRQGYSEGWLLNTWFPFWDKLTPEEQKAYLEQYPPPDEDWQRFSLRNLKSAVNLADTKES